MYMKFVENISEKEYTAFWEKTPNNHFLQSYEWGQIQAKTRKQIPLYVGLKDEKNNLVAVALLLKRKTPLHMCYFYCPRGFTLDYSNKEIVTEFTKHLKDFIKKERAIYLKIDPPIMYQEIDEEANKIENGVNNYTIFNHLINLGYKHKGFNKLYEGNQPRYTFRTYFKQYKTFEEVESTFSKSFYRPVKRSYNYDLDIYMAEEIKTFHELIKIISSKDNFHEYPYSYYKTVYTEMKQRGHIKVFNAKINPEKLIEKFQKEYDREKKEERKTKLQKDIEYLNSLENKKEHIIASLICTYSKSGAWSLYIGNNDTATTTGTVNRLYYEFLKDAFINKYEYADLFGVVGDPHTKYKNLAGIYEYKRKMGGNYIEFIGEFDLINKPLWYIILPSILKIYRKLKK